ncbi:MAG: hypothetical protein ABIR18_02800 [Chitinophagaceae bacterium]
MKKSAGITAIKSRISFHKKKLRKFVNNKSLDNFSQLKGSRENRFSSYETINFSSTLLPIDGTLDILFDAKHPEALSRVSIPVESAFLVTCTKEGLQNYKVTWSCSLS